ncbi:MAG: hypothetical protein ACR2PR_04230 [Pseudohongiellaceae bacterium]
MNTHATSREDLHQELDRRNYVTESGARLIAQEKFTEERNRYKYVTESKLGLEIARAEARIFCCIIGAVVIFAVLDKLMSQ